MPNEQSINRQLPRLEGRALFRPDTYNSDDNTIEVVFATENPVLRVTWDEDYNEVLLCREGNVRMERINAGAPVVDTHGTWSLQDQFGVVEKAWVDTATNECRALIRLSQRDEWKGIVQDILTGIIRNISVGYLVYRYEVDDSGDSAIPVYRATDWEPVEISFAPVPADFRSGTRSASQNTTNQVTIIRKNSNTMSNVRYGADAGTENRTDTTTAAQAPASAAPAAQTVNDEQVRTLERTRITEITKAVRATGLAESFADKLISDGTPLDQARAAIIDEAAAKTPVEPRFQTGVRTGVSDVEKRQQGMEAAIMQRAGIVPSDKVVDPGEFRGMTLLDLAKECLKDAGVDTRGMNQMTIALRALEMKRSGGGLATGDFSYVLANVLNKSLRAAYDLQERTFIPWTRKSTATDFKQMLRAQLNDIKLNQVQEGGEYTYASLGDSGETYKVAKYGKIININWEAIVNDDLGAFTRIPQFLAGAVAQMQADVVYGILTGSHKMYDNNELFDATNHSNYTATGTAIAVNSLGIGRQAMRSQKSPAGNVLNIAPKFLIVGAENEQLALQYTSQQYVSAKSSDINVWAGLLQPIVEGRITGKQWYLGADPKLVDTIEWAVLDGEEIFTETRYGFEVDSLQYKVRSVFGAKAIDWRSLYKNAGA
ncbi:prohead protease/major capsid protein fusion protein [Chitinophaga sp. sic0106]|uniref:prohead protease/major capsid protein fusion protein n=1 Tax=Chitinophaga sp. sic0106 TaxID=2854785 RepID=UPI001C488DE5|nr:prohead protease/major capsid protein fusion protein [Chitinophaga sp. sic0106]MBV7529029.1 Mu-like prophage major head subunit gpT family protein [Chitinophaga sp. sic0106]